MYMDDTHGRAPEDAVEALIALAQHPDSDVRQAVQEVLESQLHIKDSGLRWIPQSPNWVDQGGGPALYDRLLAALDDRTRRRYADDSDPARPLDMGASLGALLFDDPGPGDPDPERAGQRGSFRLSLTISSDTEPASTEEPPTVTDFIGIGYYLIGQYLRRAWQFLRG